MRIGERSHTFEFVNGLRGIAALQVVILHYVSAFLPAFSRGGTPTHYGWEEPASHSPIFLLAQGYSAVYLFFLMSGFVLAAAFTRSKTSVTGQLAKRSIRLYIPVAAAVAFSALCLLMFSNVHLEAIRYSHSSWLAALLTKPLTVSRFLKDLLLNSMVAGYLPASIFTSVSKAHAQGLLVSNFDALDPPLWTLHLEFWGSLCLLAVSTFYRSIGTKSFWSIYTFLLFFAGSSFLSLFLLGFALYTLRHRFTRTGTASDSVGALFIATGCVLGFAPWSDTFGAFLSHVSSLPTMQAYDGFQMQCECSSILIFTGFLTSQRLQTMASGRVTTWLGKVSFSLYLVHFPILMTLGCWAFVTFMPCGYLIATTLSFVVGTVMSLAVAAAFEHFIDRWAVEFSRDVSIKLSD